MAISVFLLLAGCQHRLIKQPLSAVPMEWSQWGGNARQDFFIPTREKLSGLKVIKRMKLLSSPGKTLLVSGDVLFVPTLDGKLTTFSLRTFKKIGQVKLPQKLAGTAALIHNDLIVALRFNKKSLFRLNPLNGKKVWTAKLGSIETEPLVVPPQIFVTTLYKGVVAVNDSTGKILWEHHLSAQSHSSPNLIQNQLVFGDDRGNLRAVKPATGDSLWTAPLGGIIRAMPVGDAERVYLGTTRGDFYAVAAKTGHILWKFSVGVRIFHEAAVTPEGIFIVANDGFLYKLSPETGRLLWKHSLRGVAGTPPLVYGSRILLGTLEHRLLLIDRFSGKIIQEITLKGRARTLPVITKHFVIAGSENKWVYILKKESTP
ncbi:MAG: PQQ-binding-like beta-propeller repeat protein [Calditrichaeota bacterium]|nr:PQQ-binding-like beta-propeller repeat protein [Calditrichota bacterium]